MEEEPWKDHCVLLNKDEENELEIFGYKTQGWRRVLCIAGYIFSCGALLLLFYWKVGCVGKLHPLQLGRSGCCSAQTTDEFQRYTCKKVTWIDLSTLALPVGSNSDDPLVADKDSIINGVIMKPQLKMRCIQVQKIHYIWDFSVKEFKKVGSLEDSNTCHSIHHKFGAGLTREEQKIRGQNKRILWLRGETHMDGYLLSLHIEMLDMYLCQPISRDFAYKILNPFHVFQAFTLILWLIQGYTEYSVAIAILSIVSVGLTMYNLRQMSLLRSLPAPHPALC